MMTLAIALTVLACGWLIIAGLWRGRVSTPSHVARRLAVAGLGGAIGLLVLALVLAMAAVKGLSR